MSAVASSGATPVTSVVDGVISATPCRLSGIAMYNSGAAQCFVILYDNASTASGNSFSLKNKDAVADSYNYFFFGDEGINFSNGIYVDFQTAGVLYSFVKK